MANLVEEVSHVGVGAVVSNATGQPGGSVNALAVLEGDVVLPAQAVGIGLKFGHGLGLNLLGEGEVGDGLLPRLTSLGESQGQTLDFRLPLTEADQELPGLCQGQGIDPDLPAEIDHLLLGFDHAEVVVPGVGELLDSDFLGIDQSTLALLNANGQGLDHGHGLPDFGRDLGQGSAGDLQVDGSHIHDFFDLDGVAGLRIANGSGGPLLHRPGTEAGIGEPLCHLGEVNLAPPGEGGEGGDHLHHLGDLLGALDAADASLTPHPAALFRDLGGRDDLLDHGLGGRDVDNRAGLGIPAAPSHDLVLGLSPQPDFVLDILPGVARLGQRYHVATADT